MTCFSPGASEVGRASGPAPCPVCDAGIADGDLCLAHRTALLRDMPDRLVKRTPPKWRSEAGHGGTPDWLWTVVLVLFVIWLLVQLGVLR